MKICGFLLGGADIVISNLRWNNAHFQWSKDFGKMILIRFFMTILPYETVYRTLKESYRPLASHNLWSKKLTSDH